MTLRRDNVKRKEIETVSFPLHLSVEQQYVIPPKPLRPAKQLEEMLRSV